MFKRIFWITIVLCIALLVAMFAYYNQDDIMIQFLSWQVTMSAAFIYIAVFALGIVVTFVLLLPSILMQKFYIIRMHGRVRALQKLTKKLYEDAQVTDEEMTEKSRQIESLVTSMEKYEKQNMLMSFLQHNTPSSDEQDSEIQS